MDAHPIDPHADRFACRNGVLCIPEHRLAVSFVVPHARTFDPDLRGIAPDRMHRCVALATERANAQLAFSRHLPSTRGLMPGA
jgi:hypothetical protein